MKKFKKLILLGAMLFVVSCGNSPEKQVQKDVEVTFKALQSGNVEEIRKVDKEAAKAFEDPEYKEILQIFLDGYKKITYKVNSTKVNGNKATVNTHVKAPDFSKYFPEMMAQLQKEAIEKVMNGSLKNDDVEKFATEYMRKYLSEKLNATDLSYIEKDLNIIYEKKGNNWIISSDKENDEFTSMLTFGLDKMGE